MSLLAAARPLFAEHGYAAISTDQIARAAGATRGALHHQFAGKEELFAAVVEQIEAGMAAGWERWREICFKHGVGLVERALQALIDAGLVAQQPVRPLAHVVAGALDEAALYAARAADRAAATKEVRGALIALVSGLLTT